MKTIRDYKVSLSEAFDRCQDLNAPSIFEWIQANFPLLEYCDKFLNLPLTGDSPPYTKETDYLKGKCLLHQERKGNAFVVYPKNNRWRCYGKCQGGGNIIELHWRLFYKPKNQSRYHAAHHLVDLIWKFYGKKSEKGSYETVLPHYEREDLNTAVQSQQLGITCRLNREKQRKVLKMFPDYSVDSLNSESPYELDDKSQDEIGNIIGPRLCCIESAL
jgi:hypothetical protein